MTVETSAGTATGEADRAAERTSLVRFARIDSVPKRVVVWTLATAIGAATLGALGGWPLWAVVLAGIIPVVPLLTLELSFTHRHYGMLSFFTLLVITQTGHFIEHIVQMLQIHLWDMAVKDSHGIFGRLDIEWVHVIFNTWVLLAIAALVWKYRFSYWLWAGLVIALWHETEHLYIITQYITEGSGGPGLLADGGRIAGGVPVRRPELHFVYNVVETLPLYVGFVYAVKDSYDRWLAQAFPSVPTNVLRAVGNRMATRKVAEGETLAEAGDTADTMYVISRGRFEVVADDRRVAELGPGQVVGEIAVLRDVPRSASVLALEAGEVLEIGPEALDALRRGGGEDGLDALVTERLEALARR